MTVIKLPIKRLIDLEQKIAQLEQHIEQLNGRCEAQDFLLERITLQLPHKKAVEISLSVKSWLDFYEGHPAPIDKTQAHFSSYLSTLQDAFDNLTLFLDKAE
ncbi:hypothetical protein HD_1535 [[Haemophilus] ducreyi 35000HP]|uniref:Uncharacterized protein n=1 Tax=Haemophilus ducreyi (strain 35000HP / ATCC 700724) TaxID=233412 RepID=Q7VLC6_HAEDU|nr:hypothetical protein [[Haemophilus] ducreyi]AAP96322.1 hypothetical protein HD_1535 [[Haemophilus] ducreyi 35000HP]